MSNYLCLRSSLISMQGASVLMYNTFIMMALILFFTFIFFLISFCTMFMFVYFCSACFVFYYVRCLFTLLFVLLLFVVDFVLWWKLLVDLEFVCVLQLFACSLFLIFQWFMCVVIQSRNYQKLCPSL